MMVSCGGQHVVAMTKTSEEEDSKFKVEDFVYSYKAPPAPKAPKPKVPKEPKPPKEKKAPKKKKEEVKKESSGQKKKPTPNKAPAPVAPVQDNDI